jgi:hypothetical protein
VGEDRIEDYQDAFARMEGQVDAGNHDLSALGFWRLVGRVKAEPRLAEHWADIVARIDRKAFEGRVGFRLPVWLGNLILGAGSTVLVTFVPLGVGLARRDPESPLAGLLVLVAAGGLAVTVHDLAHWAAGRAAGIRFSHYFLDGPLRIQPGLKIEYASYLRASPEARARMHAAGAVASKVAPFAVFGSVYLPHRAAGYDLLPSWSLWAVLAFGAVQLLTDVVFSRKNSDWKKVGREIRISKAQRRRGR